MLNPVFFTDCNVAQRTCSQYGLMILILSGNICMNLVTRQKPHKKSKHWDVVPVRWIESPRPSKEAVEFGRIQRFPRELEAPDEFIHIMRAMLDRYHRLHQGLFDEFILVRRLQEAQHTATGHEEPLMLRVPNLPKLRSSRSQSYCFHKPLSQTFAERMMLWHSIQRADLFRRPVFTIVVDICGDLLLDALAARPLLDGWRVGSSRRRSNSLVKRAAS